jgi:chromosome partitioning protein
VIAVANHKGGVGKTTTAVNLAACLAEAGRRVLLTDLDPQGHASEHLGLKWPDDDEHTPVGQVLMGFNPKIATITSRAFEFDVLAGGKQTAVAQSTLESHRKFVGALAKAIELSRDQWDVILLDTPPQPASVLTQAALRAADAVLVPLVLDHLPWRGFEDLLNTLQVEREHNPKLRLCGWFVTDSNLRAVLARDVLERARAKCPAEELKTVIRANQPLAVAPAWAKPITAFDAKSPGAKDYRALAQELIARGIVA